MKRFTLLVITLAMMVFSSMAQISPVPNAFIKHTVNGSIKDYQNYDSGLMLTTTNGTNDIMVYSIDGETFTNLETLELNTASSLTGWQGSNLAFYYGNNTGDGVGVDLRVNDNGSARLLWNETGGHDPAYPALTNPIRVDYGADGYRYYYAFGADSHPITGLNIKLYESDGSDFGTVEVANESNGDPFDPQPIEIKTTSAIDNGQLEGVMFNGKLHFIAGYPGSLGNHYAIYYIDFDLSGSTANYLIENESEV